MVKLDDRKPTAVTEMILVDGDTIIDGGAAAFLGVLPSGKKIVAAVRDCLKP